MRNTLHRHWLNKTGLTADGGPIDERDLHRYFNTAKSRVYVAGLCRDTFARFRIAFYFPLGLAAD